MRKLVIHALLWVLNSRWLNGTPCKYGFINNISAFDLENLESEDRQCPGITVRKVLDMAKAFSSCPIRKNGVTVIEGSSFREATEDDYAAIKNLGKR